MPLLDRGIEGAARRDRWVAAASLLVVVALAWLYLFRVAAGMAPGGMEAMPGVAMPGMPPQGAQAPLLTFLMWAVMMVGMMLPGAAPTVLFYAALVRKNNERGTALPAVWIFTGGYLAVWTAFALSAALAQLALEKASLVTPAMVSASSVLSAAILIAAGVYQWLPVKRRCLTQCRNPLQFFTTRWRPGARGAFRMGAEHGMYCLGCCWMLMLLLFVAGVMNLAWVALIAAFVLIEKLLSAPRFASGLAGGVLLLSGLLVLIRHPM